MTFSSGDSLTAGNGNGQVGSAQSIQGFTNNLTGTWRWMAASGSISAGGGDTAFAYGLLVRIS